MRAKDLHLSESPPYIVLAASNAKNRQEARQVIPNDLARRLKILAARKLPTALLWPGNWHKRPGWMFGLDLVDAGFAKKYKAEKTDGERIEGGCSPPDLPPKTAQSRKSGTSEKQQKYVWKRSRIDSRTRTAACWISTAFGSRSSPGSAVPAFRWFRRKNSPGTSDPKLTSNVYTRLHRVDEASALAALPRLRIPPRRRAATGTRRARTGTRAAGADTGADHPGYGGRQWGRTG